MAERSGEKFLGIDFQRLEDYTLSVVAFGFAYAALSVNPLISLVSLGIGILAWPKTAQPSQA